MPADQVISPLYVTHTDISIIIDNIVLTNPQALAPYVTKAIGLDVSSNMLDQYNQTAQETGLGDKMMARKGDLLAENLSDDMKAPELFNFDLVVVSMSLHHFANPGTAMKRLGERLKKGGALFIIDFVPEDKPDHGFHGQFAEAAKTVRTHGFTRQDMEKLYSDAGLSEGSDYQVLEKPVEFTKNGDTMRKTVFVARSQKA